jgi:hypothetical protein
MEGKTICYETVQEKKKSPLFWITKNFFVETAFTLRSEVTLYHSTILLKKNLPEQN